MTLPQAIGFGLPRRRANCANWDDASEFLMYVVMDIVATDWEVQFPNGRIIEDFEYATRYAEGRTFQPVAIISDFGGTDGSSSPVT